MFTPNPTPGMAAGAAVRDEDYVSFGDVCRDRLQMQCQYGSRYVDPREKRPGGVYLGRHLSLTGFDANGHVNDYHQLRIHRDDAEQFVMHVAAYKVQVGAWPMNDPRIPVMPPELFSYLRGQVAAWLWIDGGGSLDADGPDTRDEALFNGFIDALAQERHARASQA